MKAGKFEATSKNGDLQEALAKAISIAKETLETDYITWELDWVTGEDGGAVTVQILKVRIYAQGPNT